MAEKKKKPKGNTLTTFALETRGTELPMLRIFAEHADQRFTISTVPTQLAKEYPDRPITPDVEFDFQGCLNLACKGFVGDPSIGDDKHARQKLSGMVIFLASLMGLTDVEVQS